MSKDKFAINYVNADGEIKRGFISQENTKESFPDPESGEYYGLEYFKNGKRVIQVIEKSAFLKAIPCINDTNKIIDKEKKKADAMIDEFSRKLGSLSDEIAKQGVSSSQKESSIDVDSLIKQFSGKKFGSLIIKQNNSLDRNQTMNAIQGTKEMIPSNLEPELKKWWEKISSSSLNESFWSRDCGEAYMDISQQARLLLEKNSTPATSENIFNICQLIILYFSLAMHESPSFKGMVRRGSGESSIGCILTILLLIVFPVLYFLLK